MAILQIGSTAIPYIIQHKEGCKQKRIEVTPDAVNVIVPEGFCEKAVAEFMHSRRRWVFEKRMELLQEVGIEGPWPNRFVSGAKVMFRGRRMKLHVARKERQRGVQYNGGFYVSVPPYIREGNEEQYVKKSLTAWLQDRVKQDADAFIVRHGQRHELIPASIRILDQKHLWGACSSSGNITLNWRLVFAPKAVLEYAVGHELCHLKHRHHGPEFWELVRTILPDYRLAKEWLEANEKIVGRDG